ncbi:MAG TPA: TraR/DksA C4-type zinc finger protein [Acidimicrobiales bacterium]|nr:TraR/DksA C4-type zinc finger protein [Acidimicrobiales bacterium]
MTVEQVEQATLQAALVAERERTAARVAGLERAFESVVESSAAAPPDDEHDPEGSTAGFERAQISTLLENDKAHLADLDRALERLNAGVYGICHTCGHEIVVERLVALPAARTCAGCAHAVHSPLRRA